MGGTDVVCVQMQLSSAFGAEVVGLRWVSDLKFAKCRKHACEH